MSKNSFLDNLEWRFATKKFNPDKKVNKQDLQKILEAIKMTPTSFGLQPFRVIVVNNQELKNKLKIKSYLQPQVSDASHLLIFCSDIDIKKRINYYIEQLSQGKAKEKLKLQPQKLMMLQSVKTKNEQELKSWVDKQLYIALGFGLAACAELQIDSCPMEGFSSSGYNKLLNLPDNLSATVLLAVGYRLEEPKRAKFRFSEDDLFINKDK